MQGSGEKHKFQEAIDIKALKFYPNASWDNELYADETFFTEYHIDPITNESYLNKRLFELRQELALFAHVRSEYGGFEYVFKGWYKVNHAQTLALGKVCYERISTLMPTYYSSTEQSVQIAKAVDGDREVAFFYSEDEVQCCREKYHHLKITYL